MNCNNRRYNYGYKYYETVYDKLEINKYIESYLKEHKFKLYWFDYVNWYNNIRIHGSLDYMTPTQWHNLP